MELSQRSIVGVVLILIGTALFFPAVTPSTGQFVLAALSVGTAALVVGTYLVGTDVKGQIV
ncbi:MAG: hypothetical protein ABEJ79_04855 [Halolamina sp.]